MLGPQEHEQIAAAIEKAKARPMPLDAPVGEEYAPQQLQFGTYRAAISFEEQPLGLMRHLSICSHDENMTPGPEVMKMLAEAFGFSAWPPERGRAYLEEFEPGRQSVNVIETEAE